MGLLRTTATVAGIMVSSFELQFNVSYLVSLSLYLYLPPSLSISISISISISTFSLATQRSFSRLFLFSFCLPTSTPLPLPRRTHPPTAVGNREKGASECVPCTNTPNYDNDGNLKEGSNGECQSATIPLLLIVSVFLVFYMIGLLFLFKYLKRRRDRKEEERKKEARALLRSTMADRQKLMLEAEKDEEESLISRLKAVWKDIKDTYPIVLQLMVFGSRMVVSSLTTSRAREEERSDGRIA